MPGWLARFLLLLFCGCASEYQPKTTEEFAAIHEFSGKGAVALINGQPSTDRIFFSGRYYANPNEWTKRAIEIANREITKRGISVRSAAPKSLTLAIQTANTHVGWVNIISTITMSARASNGYTKIYTGQDFSVMAGNPRTEMDTALMRVVAAMLSDPQIAGFLTK